MWGKVDTRTPAVLGGKYTVRASDPPGLVPLGTEVASHRLQLVMAQLVKCARANIAAAMASGSVLRFTAELSLYRANTLAHRNTYVRTEMAVLRLSENKSEKRRDGTVVVRKRTWYQPRIVSFDLWAPDATEADTPPAFSWIAPYMRDARGVPVESSELANDLVHTRWGPQPPSSPQPQHRDAGASRSDGEGMASGSGGSDEDGGDESVGCGSIGDIASAEPDVSASAVVNMPPPPVRHAASVVSPVPRNAPGGSTVFAPTLNGTSLLPSAAAAPPSPGALRATGDPRPARLFQSTAGDSPTPVDPLPGAGRHGGAVATTPPPTAPPASGALCPRPAMPLPMLPTAVAKAAAMESAKPVLRYCVLLNVAAYGAQAVPPPPLVLTEAALTTVNTVRGQYGLNPIGANYCAHAATAVALVEARTDGIVVETMRQYTRYDQAMFEPNGALPCLVPVTSAMAASAPYGWRIVLCVGGGEAIHVDSTPCA